MSTKTMSNDKIITTETKQTNDTELKTYRVQNIQFEIDMNLKAVDKTGKRIDISSLNVKLGRSYNKSKNKIKTGANYLKIKDTFSSYIKDTSLAKLVPLCDSRPFIKFPNTNILLNVDARALKLMMSSHEDIKDVMTTIPERKIKAESVETDNYDTFDVNDFLTK